MSNDSNPRASGKIGAVQLLHVIQQPWIWSQPKSVATLSITLLVLLVLLVAGDGLFNPSNNFDTIGYVASMYAESGYTGQKLSNHTYEDIKRSMSAQDYKKIIAGGHYQSTVYSDPKSLSQQLPFYDIRVAYIYMAKLFALTGSTDTNALRYTSLCLGVACVFVLAAILAAVGLPVAFTLPLACSSGLIYLAQLTTPDVMAMLWALFVAYILILRYDRIALLAVIFFPAIRTDFVIFSVLIGIYHARTHKSIVLPLVSVVASITLYETINIIHGNYGYFTLINFTFLKHFPYPENEPVSTHIALYLRAYLYAFHMAVKSPYFYPWFIGLFFATGLQMSNPRDKRLADIFFLALGFFFAHMLLLPAYHERFFAFFNAITFLVLAVACQTLYLVPGRPPIPAKHKKERPL